MAIRELVKTISGPLPVIAVCSVLLFSLCYLIVQSLSDDASGELQFWITLLGTLGIAILLFFLATNGYALFRQYARDEMGSKLTAKLVVIFLLLMLIPFSLIYFFSIQFLNKGVDSWFDIRVDQAVEDALFLGQTSLQGVKDDIESDVERYANNLLKEDLDDDGLLRALEDIRNLEDYAELSLFASDGRIVVFSIDDNFNMLPDPPGEEVFSELQVNPIYTSLEPISDNTQQLRVMVKIDVGTVGREFYALQAIKLLPLSYANLASSVESAMNQYDQMVFARGPLRFSLMLTLSLISLASLLFSILAAVYLTKRLVAPISHLAEGTEKIAKGDYGSHLPVTSSDELGILTASFNDMSSKIEDAQRAATLSQQETEQQKGYLEAVLTQLSSGVFSFDSEQRLQVRNRAAAEILSLDLGDAIGKTTSELATQHPTLETLMQVVDAGLGSGHADWQEEVTMLGTHGRQLLIVRGTRLQAADSRERQHNNYVVVFDDVTDLIQAQRDAAWGEVARRLAHEIKNPLTPIQLSAERIRSKFANQSDPKLQEMLDRSTSTIVHQVESMKEMVNAFSSYAQPVRATLLPLDLNKLIREVVELHATPLKPFDVQLQLDKDLPEIKANYTALRQVLNNLIINSCHALEEQGQGTLRIATTPAPQVSGNYIDMVVEDSGVGIPHEIRDSLFDPYVSSKAKGSGLGLAIVKRIVEEHSGSVWANDSKLGGTAMHLRLPVNAMQTYRGARGQSAIRAE